MLYPQILTLLASTLLCIQAASIRQIDRRIIPGGQLANFYQSAHNFWFKDEYGGRYSVELDAETLCGDEIISNYFSASSGDSNADRSTTLAHMLQDFDAGSKSSAYDSALDALEAAQSSAFNQLSACNELSYDGTTTIRNSAADRHNWIKAANNGSITATMIKGTGTVITAGLSLTATFLSDQEAKLVTSAIAGGVATVLLFILNAIVEWVKNQGALDKSDAVILKTFAEWSRSTLVTTEQELMCYSTHDALENANQIVGQDSSSLGMFGLVSGDQVAGALRTSRSCGTLNY